MNEREAIMSKTDLNLIVMFDAIMTEQSVTAAAERLSMTQPSVSNAIARMRHYWKDPLFVKHGRGVRPTPYAKKLWQQVSSPLTEIQQAVTPAHFVPLYAKRQFRIALTDGMTGMLWLPLRKHIEKHAPGIDIHAVPYKVDGEQLLLDADVDLVLDYYPGSNPLIHSQWVLDNHFVCLMRPEHELANTVLTLGRFIKHDHLFVSLSGDAKGIVDVELEKQGLQRRIAMTVNSFSGAVEIIRGSNLITVLPYPVIANAAIRGEVIVKPVPLTIPPAPISIAWHTRNDRDVGLEWLRGILSELISDLSVSFGEANS
jgi:DNA-binding transcriptional LysR family regulator